MRQKIECKERTAKSREQRAKSKELRAESKDSMLYALRFRVGSCSTLCALCFMLIVFWGCATTKSSNADALTIQEPTVITGIDIQDNAFTVTADKPFIYTIYKPGDLYKIVIDMPDVTIGNYNKRIVSNKAGLTEIVPSQIESPSIIARLEVLLQTPSSIQQEYKNNVLTVKLEENTTEKEPSPIVQVSMNEETKPELTFPEKRKLISESPMPKATEVSNIAFESSPDAVKVLIKGNGSMVPNIFPLDNRIVIDIQDVVMNATIPSTVISPVKGIRSGKHDDKIRLVLDIKEEAMFDVDAAGDSIIVSFKRKEIPSLALARLSEEEMEVEQEIEDFEEKEISLNDRCQAYLHGRENINFDFQDQDIVPVFRLFADISGCNLFVHPDVKGKATMKFRDVPWNQALDTILKTFSLGRSVEGNIIRIAPHTVFVKESEEKAKAEEAGIKAEPLETMIFPISYADVSSVEAAIKNAKILSPRGNINLDKRTSTMIVKDIPSVFPEVENLLSTLDRPTPQVLIEARIVEVNTASTMELGIQWGINIHSTDTLMSAGGLSGVPNLLTGPFTGGNYLVDFPSKSAGPLSGSGITFGILNPARTIGLDLQLSALETTGKGKVISNPKILTVDKGKAKILQGKSIPVRKLTPEGTISTEFKDVTLELLVTPHITPDKSIGMSVEIKKEELDATVPSVEGVPGTDKKEANTNVIIKDGETVVIGGMYKIQENESQSGVPGLMKIPILGWLFKSDLRTTTTNELLIFITPRIVEKP
jgi:type IV pilus assembly protein PilQ